MTYPLIKDPAHYAGQFGVPWSGSELGIRMAPRAVVLYVDKDHPNASDNADGTDPNSPKLTIQSAVSSGILTTGSYIVVFSGDYSETVVTGQYGTAPGYVNLIGVASGNRKAPYWASPAAASPCLDLRTPGWRVSGIRFAAHTAAFAVYIRCTVPNANDIAINTLIEDCQFYGQSTGLGGIAFHGAPYEVEIKHCRFEFFHNAGMTATAIADTDVSWASAYRTLIEDCQFLENDRHINLASNVSIIRNCIFHNDGTYAPNITVDLRDGTIGHNIVTGCVLPGDYSNAGGYYDTAAGAGFWGGNFTNDLAEAEVSDGGVTIAPPAA